METYFNTNLSQKHFQSVFVEIKKHNSFLKKNRVYSLIEGTTDRFICTSELVDIKTIKKRDLDTKNSYLAFNCDVDISKQILDYYNVLDDEDLIDILTFKNHSNA